MFDLVVMSLGGFMSDDDGTLFGDGIRRLLDDGLCVAAAGNQSTSRPYFPAALHDVVGVGGLGQADKAWFTNFGGWVDACAPAIDVISTFFRGQRQGSAEGTAVHGLGAVERDELRRAEGGRRHRPGHVPPRLGRPLVLEAAVGLPPLPVPDLGIVFNV